MVTGAIKASKVEFPKKRVAIVGSRRRNCRAAVEALVKQLGNVVVVSGGCRGVDQWAEDAARACGLDVAVHRPRLKDIRSYYDVVKAFYARNKRIASDCDVMYAFPAEDRKGGTENAIRHAQELGKQVIIL